ncbi:MAG: hypothetical protein ACI9HK_004645 [Pirellulaceae bacterium]
MECDPRWIRQRSGKIDQVFDGLGIVTKRTHDLDSLTEDQLLDLRICDLGVTLRTTSLERRIEELERELSARGIRFRPHFWLSDDWFSPDGVPGIAIPFYLAHPRLIRLERKQMLEVEGGAQQWCMQILRHETGHAIDNAFRLRRKRRYREVFGKVSQPYPKFYQPKPFSKRYVQHLDMWYAQAHPVEDFAETFAVWLRPRSRWRIQYRDWPALKKLEFVDELMEEIQDKKPLIKTRSQVEPLGSIRKTLREHYREKRDHYGIDHPHFCDRDLRRLFSDETEHSKNRSAAPFLNRLRPEIRRTVSKWTGEYQYTIDQVLTEMIDRCRELRLKLRLNERETKGDAIGLVTVQTMNYLHQHRHRVAL